MAPFIFITQNYKFNRSGGEHEPTSASTRDLVLIVYKESFKNVNNEFPLCRNERCQEMLITYNKWS